MSSEHRAAKEIAVVIGPGGIGLAIARRVGAGRTLLLAAHDDKASQAAAVSSPVASEKPSASADPATGRPGRPGTANGARWALAAALLGFFVMTLDALIVNVALPEIGRGFGGGMTGLQWVVDGYTLMFAALLLSAGSVTDRIGARQAFGAGLVVFTLASAACGFAPDLGVLVVARLVQGAGAAVIVPMYAAAHCR